MNDQYLKDRGFSQFKPSPFDSENVETCFQKKYKDDEGIRYFITIRKWRQMTHPHTGDVWGPSYEYSTHLYKKGDHAPLEVLFYSDWRLEDVETYLGTAFNSGLFDYYERFDEE